MLPQNEGIIGVGLDARYQHNLTLEEIPTIRDASLDEALTKSQGSSTHLDSYRNLKPIT